MQLALGERLWASGVRLAISVVILACAGYLIAVVWYPDPLYRIAGGWQGLRILLLVEIVLGPLLTLLVFDRSKGSKKLGFDLVFMACLQIGALGIGLWLVYGQKPLAVVYSKGEFNVLVAADYADQEASSANLNRFGSERPLWLYAREPETVEEGAGTFAYMMVSGLAEWQLDYLLEPLASNWETVASEAVPPAEFLAKFPEQEGELDRLAAQAGGVENLRCFAVSARYGDALLVFDQDGRLLGALAGEDFDEKMFGLI